MSKLWSWHEGPVLAAYLSISSFVPVKDHMLDHFHQYLTCYTSSILRNKETKNLLLTYSTYHQLQQIVFIYIFKNDSDFYINNFILFSDQPTSE